MEEIKDIIEILELLKEDIENNNENASAILDLQDLKSLSNLYNAYKVQNKQLNDAFSRGWVHKDTIRDKYLRMEKEYAEKVYNKNYNTTEVKKEEFYKRQVYKELLEEE